MTWIRSPAYLATEAGRWLVRTGLFRRVCFVDYKSFQGIDACGIAVSTLGTALGQTLLDADAATEALRATPTLVILDNVEAVQATAAAELLTAAKAWSEAGDTRVLVTTRHPDLEHPDWPTQKSKRCRYLNLKGLQADDALDWFQALMALPPEPTVALPDRDALMMLFGRVGFHPLTIGVLAQVLKTCRIAEVGERLEAMLKVENNPLIASLFLSIRRLPPELRAHLPSLGVFRGGAADSVITRVTQVSAKQWEALRAGLEQTGLICAEALPACQWSYLRFHPALAPALWDQLSTDKRATLITRHREVYYAASIQLYHGVAANPEVARATAWYELPNFMAAAEAAIDAGDANAADFADNVGTFLGWFGMARDRADLAARAQAAAGSKGSKAWFAARLLEGGQLFDAGRYREAETAYSELLEGLSKTAGFNYFFILRILARCRGLRGRSDQAEELQQRALSEIGNLEQTLEVRRLTGFLYADLGDTLADRGELPRARSAHEQALAIAREQHNQLAVRVSLSALGRIAFARNDPGEAEKLLEQARVVSQALKDPALLAADWQALGRLHAQASDWEKAEHAFREAASFSERTGNLKNAATCWMDLATVMFQSGRLGDAESWYRKACDACRAAGDPYGESNSLHNLANLLSHCPGRLADAQHFAEEAFAIRKTLDPAATQIWKSYEIFATIAAAEDRTDDAREFRRQRRRAFLDAPSSRAELQRFPVLIPATFLAAADPCMRLALEGWLEQMASNGWDRLVAAIKRLLDGERDEDALTDGLNEQESLIVTFVLVD
jgi:tetratricopeptide (TPR) repeat protein